MGFCMGGMIGCYVGGKYGVGGVVVLSAGGKYVNGKEMIEDRRQMIKE